MYDLRAFLCSQYRPWVWLVVGCLLGSVQVAHASKLVDFSRSGVTTTGNAAKIGMTSDGVAWGSTIPISPTVGGWSQAGNYGIPSAAKGPTMTLGGSGDVFFAGTKYPFQAGYTVPASNVFAGLSSAAQVVGGMAGGPVGLALLVAGTAAPYVKQWFEESGLRVDPDAQKIQYGDPTYCGVGPCYEYRGMTALPWKKSPEQACRDHAAYYASTYNYVGVTDLGGGAWQCREAWKSSGNPSNFTLLRQARAVDAVKNWYDLASMDDISPYMQAKPFDPRVVPEILASGGNIPMPAPTITGPSAIAGPTTVTRNPDGSTTTIYQTQNFSITGDTITNISNVSSTVITNSSSVIISTSTSTVTPAQKSEPVPDLCKTNPNSVACASKEYLDQIVDRLDKIFAKPDPQTDCDKKPNSIGCQEFGTPPTDEVPKSTVALTYQTESHFGGGSCPSNKSMQIRNGPSVVVADWVTICDQITTWVRPLLLTLAAFGALMVLAPGLREGTA